MRIIDAHCDVLWKLYENPELSFTNSPSLQVTAEQLRKTHAAVQACAIFVDPVIPTHRQFRAVEEMVALFEQKILGTRGMKQIYSRQDIPALRDSEVGVLLTVEGCDWMDEELLRLKWLITKGVKMVGLTWNFVNKLADGAMEPRGAGLTQLGFRVIDVLNTHKVMADVSHLSEKGFWDVLTSAHHPVASHSNVYSLCPHPRNLRTDQLQALIDVNSWMGITFVPFFLTEKQDATIKDILLHLDFVCALGGERNVGFGSDFDGIQETVLGLSSHRDYNNLVNELQKHYKEEVVKGFLYDNFLHHMPV